MISCLQDMVSNAARKWPHHTAIIEITAKGTKRITYEKLEKMVENLSNQMLQKGLQKKERVGILSWNSIEFVAVSFAVLKAGGVFVPFNYTLNPIDITHQANDCAISGIYFDKRLKEKAQDIIAKVKSIRFTVEYSEDRVWTKKPSSISDEDLASIVYTSGTTREPLGVMLSHKNLLSNNRSIAEYTNINSSSKIHCVLPFYYIYGLSLLFSHFLVGGTVIIDNQFIYPNAVLNNIDKYKATGFAGVSSHYAILLYKADFKRRKLPTLRYLMQAGDKMSEAITKELLKIFPEKKIYIMYGQTEASPRLTYLDPDLVKQKPDSIGKAIAGVELKIVNKQGKECKVQEEGEIAARGDNVMAGYWNNDKETAKVIKDGWLYTGDIAFKDSQGDIFITGRRKNFIKVGAHRINPLEIEYLVRKDDRILEAAIVDVSDVILGKKIKLFVSLIPGAKITSAEIINFCKSRLPSYKIPSEVIILRSIPKNSYGKIDKQKLRLK